MGVNAVNTKGRDRTEAENGAPMRDWEPDVIDEAFDLPLIVVYPFCLSDIGLAIKNLEWMARLCGKQDRKIILSYETGTPAQAVATAARKAFADVEINCYKELIGSRKWPRGNNHAWQQTVRYYERKGYRNPWIWMETDATPVCADWLERLEGEYRKARKPFMGPIVDEWGHMNGQAIYPPNVTNYTLRAFSVQDYTPWWAWDLVAVDEIEDYTHNAGHMMRHVWTLTEQGRASIREGDAPSFPDWTALGRILDHNTCIFHRCKDGTIIDRLEERRSRDLLP